MTDHLQRLEDALAGRYIVERELDSGGMGTVYLAKDLSPRTRLSRWLLPRPHKLLIWPVVAKRLPLWIAIMVVSEVHSFLVRLL